MKVEFQGSNMKSIMTSISQPQDIQNLNLDELKQLASECRQRIIEVTSQRGGHLASSLDSAPPSHAAASSPPSLLGAPASFAVDSAAPASQIFREIRQS